MNVEHLQARVHVQSAAVKKRSGWRVCLDNGLINEPAHYLTQVSAHFTVRTGFYQLTSHRTCDVWHCRCMRAMDEWRSFHVRLVSSIKENKLDYCFLLHDALANTKSRNVEAFNEHGWSFIDVVTLDKSGVYSWKWRLWMNVEAFDECGGRWWTACCHWWMWRPLMNMDVVNECENNWQT